MPGFACIVRILQGRPLNAKSGKSRNQICQFCSKYVHKVIVTFIKLFNASRGMRNVPSSTRLRSFTSRLWWLHVSFHVKYLGICQMSRLIKQGKTFNAVHLIHANYLNCFYMWRKQNVETQGRERLTLSWRRSICGWCWKFPLWVQLMISLKEQSTRAKMTIPDPNAAYNNNKHDPGALYL